MGHAKVKMRIETLAGHRVIPGAARMIQGKDDFRNRGAGHGFDHLRAGANNAFAFGFDTHHESGNVLKIQERHVVAFRVFDEIGDFAGGSV